MFHATLRSAIEEARTLAQLDIGAAVGACEWVMIHRHELRAGVGRRNTREGIVIDRDEIHQRT